MEHKIAQKTPLKVLYLEDSPHDIEIIRELLKDAGYDFTMDCADKKKNMCLYLVNRHTMSFSAISLYPDSMHLGHWS